MMLEGGCVKSDGALAGRLAALAHPARIDILRHLAGVDSCCCGEVVQRLDLAQSTVSQHLKVLVEAGLVRFTPEKTRSRYEIDAAGLSAVSETLAQFIDGCCSGRR